MKNRLFLILNRYPSAVLGCFYLVGQGGYFFSQIWLKKNDQSILLGDVILLTAALSFSLQFSDFGSNTYLSAALKRGGVSDAAKFMYSRGILGIITLIISVYILPNPGLGYEVYLIPLSAFLFGFSVQGRFDAENDYARIAYSQLLPWLVIMSHILFSIYFDVSHTYLLYSFIAISLIYFDYETFKEFKFDDCKILDVLLAFPFIAPVLMGQVWARYKIGLIYLIGGNAQLGDYGMVVGLQSGLFVLMIKMARPSIARYLHENNCTPSVLVKHIGVIRYFYKELILSLIFSASGIFGVYMLSEFLDQNYNGWMMIFLVTPLFLLQSIFSNLAMMCLNKVRVVVIEHIVLCVNVGVFIIMMQYGIPIAILLAEATAAFLCVGWYSYQLHVNSAKVL